MVKTTCQNKSLYFTDIHYNNKVIQNNHIPEIIHILFMALTSTKCRLCTTLVVSLPLLPHNPPHPPLPISTRHTSSRWVNPYVPWFCLRVLPDRSEERRVRTE